MAGYPVQESGRHVVHVTAHDGMPPIRVVFRRDYLADGKAFQRIVSRTPSTHRTVELGLYQTVQRLPVKLFNHLPEDEERKVGIDILLVVLDRREDHLPLDRILDAADGVHARHHFLGEYAVGRYPIVLRQGTGQRIDRLEVIRDPGLQPRPVGEDIG